MTRLTDEILMAYADGQLPADEMRDVEERLRSDPEAQKIVESFRRAAELAASAFEAPMYDTPPARLVELIRSAPLPEDQKQSADTSRDNVVSLAQRRKPPVLTTKWALPMAAAIALTAGLAAVWSFNTGPDLPAGSELALGAVPRQSELASLLDQRPTGAELLVSNDRRAVVMATFVDRRGRFCREVEIVADGEARVPVAAGVACREPATGWIMEGSVRISNLDSSGAYQPAGTPEEDALKGLMELLGAGPVLSSDIEAQHIKSGWVSTSESGGRK